VKPLPKLLKELLIKGGLLKAELSEDELKQVLEASTRSGTLDKTEHELIKSILEFTDTTAKEIMVPRPDIAAIDIALPRERLLRSVIEEGYSRLPVYQGDIDHIIGVIYSKDLLSIFEHRDVIIVQDIIRPVYYVHESKKISQLLREFQQKKVHLAIVIDEYGGTEGIVTMEDIVEEIVGEIQDEYDEESKPSVAQADGSALIDAHIAIPDFNERFQANIPEAPDYETLAGYLQKSTGRLPELHEEVVLKDFHFTIMSKSARRIRLVKVKPRLATG
jgi:CBS domain containing-hemolysin-like protein